jgi:hypothetical protein
LTDIFLAVNGRQFSALGLETAQAFVPESSDVRTSAYWSISLAMSVC